MNGTRRGCIASGTLGKHEAGPFRHVGTDAIVQEIFRIKLVPKRKESKRAKGQNLKGSFKEATAAAQSNELPPFKAPTPCYLVDLQSEVVPDAQQVYCRCLSHKGLLILRGRWSI